MATVSEPVFTPDDLLRITDRPTPELIDGQLLQREPMGQEADAIGMKIVAILQAFGKSILPGLVNGPEGGYQIFADDPRRVRFPDVSFTRRDRLPDGKPARGHGKVVPDLIVEVVSPNDHAEALDARVRDFLAAGVPLVWIVYPETRGVLVLRGDGNGSLLQTPDLLDGGIVLPGFSCRVADFFE